MFSVQASAFHYCSMTAETEQARIEAIARALEPGAWSESLNMPDHEVNRLQRTSWRKAERILAVDPLTAKYAALQTECARFRSLLQECTERLEKAALLVGNNAEVAARAVDKYRQALAAQPVEGGS